MDVKYINPVLESCKKVLQQFCGISLEKGKLYLKNNDYPSKSVIIEIGMTGNYSGSISFEMEEDTAVKIASKMMGGMALDKLDDMSKSAISELGNIIMGNATTILSNEGAIVDITPPKLYTGSGISIFSKDMQTICLPMHLDNGGLIEANMSVA